MSVILRRESGQLVLLTKGAESSILPKCPQDGVRFLKLFEIGIWNWNDNTYWLKSLDLSLVAFC